MTTVLAGHTAPALRLRGLNGSEYALTEALRKGPVVVAFFKITCPVCQFTFPFLERLYQAHRGDAVTCWGISQDDARDTKLFCQEYGITFPTLLDEGGYPVSNAYGLTTVPTVLLIAPGGRVLVSSTGFSKRALQTIAAEIALHVGKEPVPVFRPHEVVPDDKPG